MNIVCFFSLEIGTPKIQLGHTRFHLDLVQFTSFYCLKLTIEVPTVSYLVYFCNLNDIRKYKKNSHEF